MVCPKCQFENPEGAKFCGRCGNSLVEEKPLAPPPKQPVAPPVTPKTSTGLSQNVAGALCYLLGFITGIIFLLLEKENKFVRFHALQSTITFVGLYILNNLFRFIPFLGWIIRPTLTPLITILGLILWIILMIKAYKGEKYKLPYIGDLVEKQIEKI